MFVLLFLGVKIFKLITQNNNSITLIEQKYY
jgi:hypothetical protein